MVEDGLTHAACGSEQAGGRGDHEKVARGWLVLWEADLGFLLPRACEQQLQNF